MQFSWTLKVTIKTVPAWLTFSSEVDSQFGSAGSTLILENLPVTHGASASGIETDRIGSEEGGSSDMWTVRIPFMSKQPVTLRGAVELEGLETVRTIDDPLESFKSP